MEHDASRLNYVLLWHVLQRRRCPGPAWAKWVVMLEAVNRSVWALGRLRASGSSGDGEAPGRLFAAYRRWADSFGLDSPLAEARRAGDAEALAFEGAAKCAVAGEALGVCGLPPSRADLEALLRTAFHPQRRGDVYSAENRALVASTLPELLLLGDSA